MSFDDGFFLSFDEDFDDFFCSFSLLFAFLFVANDDEDFVDRENELIVVRFLVVDNFDEVGDADRYERVVVVDDAGEEILSLK